MITEWNTEDTIAFAREEGREEEREERNRPKRPCRRAVHRCNTEIMCDPFQGIGKPEPLLLYL